MAEITFSNDPDNPLNKKIMEVLSCSRQNGDHLGRTQDLCREIYKMGFDDGQSYVWKMRQMAFVDDPENPGKQKAVFPGDPDYPKLTVGEEFN